MNKRIAAGIFCAALLLAGGTAYALIMAHGGDPETLKFAGIEILVTDTKSENAHGMLTFTVKRDLSKARAIDNPGYVTRHEAMLDAIGSAGYLSQSELVGEEKNGVLTYWFRLSADAARHSVLSLTDRDCYADLNKEPKFLGASDLWEIRLGDIVNKTAAADPNAAPVPVTATVIVKQMGLQQIVQRLAEQTRTVIRLKGSLAPEGIDLVARDEPLEDILTKLAEKQNLVWVKSGSGFSEVYEIYDKAEYETMAKKDAVQ